MAYKAKFRPSEILRAGQWQPLGERQVNSMAMTPLSFETV
jgi:arginyl-tRNA--protein-N-Asp/Glu arginylyltransferase